MKESATKYDCIKNIDSAGPLTLTGKLFSENLVAPTDGVAEFVLDLECAEQNCAPTFGGDMCRFDINCGALGIKTSDMVREMSQVRLRFVRGESVNVSAALPHYTLDFLLKWEIDATSPPITVVITTTSPQQSDTEHRPSTTGVQDTAATSNIAPVSQTITSLSSPTTGSNSAEHQASDDGAQQTIAIAAGVGAAVCVLMLIVFIVVMLRLQKNRQTQNGAGENTVNMHAVAPTQPTHAVIASSTSSFHPAPVASHYEAFTDPLDPAPVVSHYEAFTDPLDPAPVVSHYEAFTDPLD